MVGGACEVLQLDINLCISGCEVLEGWSTRGWHDADEPRSAGINHVGKGKGNLIPLALSPLR